ncbi:DUF3179 domain-containing protein [Candidatus Kaiserbacteria bacterium]|nr:DUF3179 domain-containing protein [Candidatus Kaiserbacteria bacterium]
MTMNNFMIAVLVVIVGLAGIILFQRFARDDFDLPRGGEAATTTITVEEAAGGGSQTTRTIMVTNNVKHSVPLDEILGGGPAKDGIPPIDDPQFVSIAEASSFLKDSEPGIALERKGVARFYPFQILVWHEIVNDTVGGQRVLVTYCPLCFTGIVFDPLVNGERVEFGTSGKLWNSNLVMYDRKTDSLWSQVLGEAIVGEQTGARLAVIPSDIMRYENFKNLYPKGEVLSRKTGATRPYGTDPYGDYYTTPGTFFPLNKTDNRLGDKEFVLGIVVNGKAKAYAEAAVKRAGEIEDRFEGKTIVARFDSGSGAVRLFEKKDDGTLVRIETIGGFWFSWASAHPDTALFK